MEELEELKKEKIRLSLLGRKRPIEVIEKMSKALKGRKRSEESKRRIGIGGTNKAINIEVILNAIEKILKFNNNFNKKQIKSLLEDNLNCSFPLIIRRFGDTQSFWNKIEKYLGFYIPDRRGYKQGGENSRCRKYIRRGWCQNGTSLRNCNKSKGSL